MNRKILIPALALAIALLSGCAASGGGGAEASRLFGQNILFIRAVSDEEAFAGLMEETGKEIIVDEAVSPAGLQGDQEEGWLLVRYTAVNGEARPLWFHVWTGESWSGASNVCEGEYWRLPTGALEMPEAQMVRPLD